MEDWQLLQEYADKGSQEAFTELTARYTPLVYSTCLRRLGDPHGAEDATQAVFIILAKKARKLRKETVLPGWLFKTAQFVSAKALRSEIRRRKHESAFAAAGNIESERRETSTMPQKRPDAAVGWETLAPVLGEAVMSLGEKDRNAVILRFFEGKSQADVGRALGMTENTASQRVSRALKKLRKFFHRKGIVIPATLLATIVGKNAIAATPPGLAANCAAAALGSAAGGVAVGSSAYLVAKRALKMMMWEKVKLVAACVAAMVALGGAAAAVKTYGIPEGEKLLLGFEKEELEKLVGTKVYYGKIKLKEVPDGFEVAIPRLSSWKVRKVKTTEGQYALMAQHKGKIGPLKGSSYFPYLPPAVARHTPSTRNAQGRLMLSIYHFFRKVFPADWSEYRFFRFDAQATIPNLLLRVVLEDENVAPPIVRLVPVPAGKWVTVQVDLARAVKERGLDLKKMLNLCIFPEQSSGGGKLLIDNLRLARQGSKARLPLAADETPMTLSDYYKATTPPGPRKITVKPNRSPLKLREPFVIDASDVDSHTDSGGHKRYYVSLAPIGFIGAFDNNHLIVGFTGKGLTTAVTKQTTDGGKTWENVGFCWTQNPDHGCCRGWAVDQTGDCTVFSNYGCATGGGWLPTPRYFCAKTTFTGQGWEARPAGNDRKNKRTWGLVDCEARHCVSNGSCVRLKNGRLWAAWSYIGRAGYVGVAAKYSDDDGITWRSWREGKTGAIPGSFDTSGKRYGTYGFMQARITLYGEHAAVIWQNKQGVFWSWFDGKEWSKPGMVDAHGFNYDESSRRANVYAVTLGEKDIFVTAMSMPGVMHWSGQSWKKEPVDCRSEGVLAVAGKTVMVFSAEKKDKGKGFKLVCFKRSPQGRWSKPQVLAEVTEEEGPISRHRGVQGLVAQPYSPPNFVPIAWSCKRQIKVLRVPVD